MIKSSNEVKLKLNLPNFEVVIFHDSQGYFEHNTLGDGCGGGLWLEGMEVTDYDGVFELPKEVREALKAEGYFGLTLED